MKFKVEIDSIDSNDWDKVISLFDDANLFQTSAFGIGRRNKVSHIILKLDEKIVGCCQIKLRKIPFLNFGLADIVRGPLFVKRGIDFIPDVLNQLIVEIKKEYSLKRGYFLRIWSHAVGEKKEAMNFFCKQEGFKINTSERPYQSLRVDLSPSISELRKSLLPRWRTSLNNSEKRGLNLIEGTNIEFFDILQKMTKETQKTKNYIDYTDYQQYRQAQLSLPEQYKIKIIICEYQGDPVCAVGYSTLGNTAYYILAGTAKKAYELNATYLVQWQMLQRAKECGMHYFDLGPFNQQRNPGVYYFKKGIAGKNGWEEAFLLGQEGCFNLRNLLAKKILNLGQQIKIIHNLVQSITINFKRHFPLL